MGIVYSVAYWGRIINDVSSVCNVYLEQVLFFYFVLGDFNIGLLTAVSTQFLITTSYYTSSTINY